MFSTKYMDGAGLSYLWERIRMLVYECAGKSAVTYRLESDGNTVTLVGSDGTSSSVAVISTASCGSNEELTPINPIEELTPINPIEEM